MLKQTAIYYSKSASLIREKNRVPGEFDKIASRYDLATRLSQGYQRDLDTSVDRMNLKGNEHVLDLCCGTGKSTLSCLNFLPAGRVTAVDSSEGMLKIACEKLGGDPRVEFLLQDAMQLNFPAKSFDAVFMAYGIRNMPDISSCLNRLFVLLKPGGQICFHEYSLNESLFSRMYWLFLGYGFIVPFCTLLTGNHTIFSYLVKSVLNFPSPRYFSKILRESGFEIIRIKPLSGWRRPILHTFIAQKPAIRQ